MDIIRLRHLRSPVLDLGLTSHLRTLVVLHPDLPNLRTQADHLCLLNLVIPGDLPVEDRVIRVCRRLEGRLNRDMEDRLNRDTEDRRDLGMEARRDTVVEEGMVGHLEQVSRLRVGLEGRLGHHRWDSLRRSLSLGEVDLGMEDLLEDRECRERIIMGIMGTMVDVSEGRCIDKKLKEVRVRKEDVVKE